MGRLREWTFVLNSEFLTEMEMHIPALGLGRRDPAAVLDAFERALGLDICIKIFHTRSTAATELLHIGHRFDFHRSSFCNNVKITADPACYRCDLTVVPSLCQKRRRAFVHTCHAGACELILPVFWEGELGLVVYVGQFRVKKSGPKTLRLIRREEFRQIRNIVSGLQSYLWFLLETRRCTTEQPAAFRREQVESFVSRNLKVGVSLGDLGKAMNLSPSRCSHVVRELCGCSFVELRDRLRLARAKNLLRATGYKITVIAEECGFEDTQYFHRFFRRHTRTTPALFRQENGGGKV